MEDELDVPPELPDCDCEALALPELLLEWLPPTLLRASSSELALIPAELSRRLLDWLLVARLPERALERTEEALEVASEACAAGSDSSEVSRRICSVRPEMFMASALTSTPRSLSSMLVAGPLPAWEDPALRLCLLPRHSSLEALALLGLSVPTRSE